MTVYGRINSPSSFHTPGARVCRWCRTQRQRRDLPSLLHRKPHPFFCFLSIVPGFPLCILPVIFHCPLNVVPLSTVLYSFHFIAPSRHFIQSCGFSAIYTLFTSFPAPSFRCCTWCLLESTRDVPQDCTPCLVVFAVENTMVLQARPS